MKKIFLMGIMSLCTVALMAQTDNANRNGGNREGRTFNPEQRYERLKQELKLNDKQIDSLKVAEKEIFGDMGRGAGARTRGGNEANQVSKEKAAELEAQMKKKNEQFDARLKNFLTEEQIKKYKELRNRPRNQNQNQDRDPNQRQGNRGGNQGGNQ